MSRVPEYTIGMAKKNVETVESLVAQIKDSFKQWEEIRKHGCNDPFYPDGTNMNLVRNHIHRYQQKLRDLCTSQKLKCPFSAKKKAPRQVSETFYSKGRKNKA